MRPSRRLLAGILASCVLWVTACDDAVEADPFVNGMVEATDGGLFDVELRYLGDGAPAPGTANWKIHVGQPFGVNEGAGIPNATVEVVAHMPNGDLEAPPIVVHDLGGGYYKLAGVELAERGVWTFDVDIAVGERVRQHASFTFELQ